MTPLWLTLLYAPSVLGLLFLPRCPSRRLLTIALTLAIPVAGPVLAVLVTRVRGGGVAVEEPAPVERRRRLGPDDARRVAELPPILERLLSSDPEERLAALVVLSTRADASSVAMLRWVVERGGPEAVLDAALTIEEIDLRTEQELDAAERAARANATLEHVLAAGDAAAAGILSGSADPAIVPVLAARARDHYRRALAMTTTTGRAAIARRLARVELAAGRPHAALELAAVDDDHEPDLRDDVRFAARRFDALTGYRPYTLAAPGYCRQT